MRILKDYGIESNQYGLKIDERLYFGKSIILVNDNKFLIPMTFKENKYTGCTDKDIRCASFQNFEYVGTVLIKYDPTKKKRQYAKHVFSASETSWSTGKWLASLCEYLANGHIPVRINNLWDAASEGDRPTNQEPCECPVSEDAAGKTHCRKLFKDLKEAQHFRNAWYVKLNMTQFIESLTLEIVYSFLYSTLQQKN